MSTFSTLFVGLALYGAQWLPASVQAASADALSTLPGTCPLGIEPPERILDTWIALDRQEGRLPPADDAESGLVGPPLTQPPPGTAPPVLVEAGKAELVRDGVSRLEEEVWLQQGENFLSTEALQFDENSGVVRTLAPARFGSRQLILDADSAVYNTTLGIGLFDDVDFFMPRRAARGEADQLARTGEFTARLDGVKYTTCPPEDEDWSLKASSLDMDQEEGIAVARNVRIAFMGVPFFYTPWLSFPIDDQRKTGFLFPEFGDSSINGAWLRTPYYFNLAPNYDATLTPYYMAERGTSLEGQFRYLFGWGTGRVEARYLEEDRITNSHRYYYGLGHRTYLPANWRATVSYRQVSDEEYFQDFSQSGNATLISHLAQQFILQRSELEYGASLQLLRYQTVDPTIPEASRPYEKWPELNYYYAPLPFFDGLWMELEGESVNFQRDNRVNGWRHHATTAFSMDFGDPGLRLTPRLAWWQTEYDLEQPDATALEVSRGLPVSSIDIEARLSRALAGGGEQTLEPRLFLLHVPYRAQDAIPLFDTRPVSDTLASLFQENRFTGLDRVGDTRRASFGLQSAFIRGDGREWLSAAIARAWYFDDRRVQLGDAEPGTGTASNYYGELEYRPSERQGLRLDLGWEPEEEQIGFGSVQYQFKPGDYQVLNLAYRYRRLSGDDALEQVDASFATPIGGGFRLFGRAVYSLEDERSQETLAGFEYETCCWVFRTFRRRFIFNRQGEFQQSVWFQLELKGLSSVGRRIDEFLTDDIYGYGETR